MYFSYITQTYIPKNNLQKELLGQIKAFDRVLVRDEDFKEFQSRISSMIIDCNAKHSRCTGIHPDWWNSHFEETDTYLHLPMLHMAFYKVESDFKV